MMKIKVSFWNEKKAEFRNPIYLPNKCKGVTICRQTSNKTYAVIGKIQSVSFDRDGNVWIFADKVR